MLVQPQTQWLLDLWRALSAVQEGLGGAEARQVGWQDLCVYLCE